jgi:hypothetical protein
MATLPVQTNGNITAQTVPLLLAYQQLESAPGGVLTYLEPLHRRHLAPSIRRPPMLDCANASRPTM